MLDRTAANLPPDASGNDPGVESAEATAAAQTQLQTKIEQLEAERDELKLLLETTTDHADAVEEELFRLNQQLSAEVQERAKAEAALRVSEAIARSLVEVLRRDKSDLEMLLETATQHGDVVGNVLLERQRRAEVENQDLFYAIAETIPLGLGVCRFADGRLVYANEAFEEIVGLTSSQILSKCLQDLPLVPEEGQALVETLKEQGTVAECELEIGEGPRWGSFTIRPLVLQGEAVHLVVLQDITARKLAEEGLRQSEAQSRDLLRDLEAIVERRTAALKEAMEGAAAANRAKSEFLASMSHELRTPLNAILGFAQLMQQDPTFPASHSESLEAIARAGEHLLGTIDDVLELSRIESGRLSLRETSFDLRALLDDLHRMMALRARSKNLELRFEVDENLPRYLIADAGKLRQIAINLLGNAVKFTERGGITLQVTGQSLAAGGGDRNYRLQIRVEDTGPGIAPEEMAGLFEPFVQTASGRRSQEGSGLGLTVSRKYARLMGGDLTATSAVGQGTCFLLTVAVRSAQAAETTQGLRPIGLAPGQAAYRILTIDDRPEMRTIVRRLLETVGFELREAATAQEALQIWQTWHPHLIWMDLQMPGCNGFQLTREIRRQEQQQGRSPTVIVALSARVFAEDRSAALAAGCDDFVSKPFLRDTLLEKISQHLGATYIYAEAATSVPEREVVAADLQRLDREWVRQLHQAVTQTDSERMHELIAHLPSTDNALQQGLQELVKSFRFDRLFDLTAWAMAPIPTKTRPDILVVEDNRVNQKIALRMLQNLGREADCVSSGAEALNHLQEHPYRLVLMDLQMEGMDGIAATLALRALENSQPERHRAIVIALTASTEGTSREACLRAGMDDFLSKPFRPAALQELLTRWQV